MTKLGLGKRGVARMDEFAGGENLVKVVVDEVVHVVVEIMKKVVISWAFW